MFDFIKVEADISKIVSVGRSKAEADAITQEISDAIAPLKSGLTTLQNSVVADEGIEASLVQRVADVETALTDVVSHLAAGNTDAATATATAALPAVGNVPAESSTSDAAGEATKTEPTDDTEKSNN